MVDLADRLARIATENRRLLERLSENERRFRSISRRVIRIQEADRGRLSRELHDGVGQALTALKIQLEVLERSTGDTELGTRLADLRELADRTLQDVRQISHLLRPPMLDDLGLAATLRWFVRTFQQRTGISAQLVEQGLEHVTEPDVATLVYRVVQEAMTNVARHARTPTVHVHVHVRVNGETARPRRGDGQGLASPDSQSMLHLTVADQGIGFDARAALESVDEAHGFGLRGMRDRVRLAGGRFSIESAPGAGTTLRVDIPLDAQEDLP